MGRDLRPILMMIRNWQRKYIDYAPDRWIQGYFEHIDCGQKTETMMACSECHERILPEHIHSKAGPGEGREPSNVKHGRRSVTVKNSAAAGSSEYFSIEGDRWSTLILAATFKGYAKFAEFETELGIGKPTLSHRLKLLLSLEMLEKKPYQEGPTRYQYLLTQKGLDFYPVILALMAFGDKWLADEQGPPVILTHTLCRADTSPELRCDKCGEPILFEHVRFSREPDSKRP